MAIYCPILLAEARHVEYRAGSTFKMRRHGEKCANGDDTRAADSGHHDIVSPPLERSERGFGKISLRLACKCRSLGFARLGIENSHETRAEAFDAAIILVAVRLIDLTFSAEFGLFRPDADAV